MKKSVIAVDVGEVLFPLSPTFLEYHNNQHQTAFTLDEMTSYYLEELTGETSEQMLEKIHAYLDTHYFRSGRPISGAIEVISRLAESFNLVIITARDIHYRGRTETWLKEHFGDLFSQLHYTHTLDEPNKEIEKYVLCQRVGAKVLIDDNLHHLSKAAEHGIAGILFGNYGWNQYDVLPDNITRCQDWQSVEAFLNANS